MITRERRSRFSTEGRPKVRRRLPWLALAAASFAVLALTWMMSRAPAPTGQVLATVDGEEVTLQDVQAEARAAAVPLLPTTEAELLQAVIDRRLLAAEAHRRKLDRAPSAPADRARLQQLWLAQQAAPAAARAHALDAATLAEVEATHPFSFSQRTVLTLDVLSSSVVSVAPKARDLDALQHALQSRGAPWRRWTVHVDTAALPAEDAARFADAPAGSLIFRITPTGFTAARVLGRDRPDAPPALEEASAEQVAAKDDSRAALNRLLGQLRRRATIRVAGPINR